MGLFRFFSKKRRIPPELERIFQSLEIRMESHKIADEAISYRNLGEYDKALHLLHEALFMHGYMPAITLIGTTLTLKGDIEAAIKWFADSIRSAELAGATGVSLPLIELYANLVVIYMEYLHDYPKALTVYHKGLQLPRPSSVPEDLYIIMVSAVHRDLALAYRGLGDLPQARNYALKRLRVQHDCEHCKAVIAFCDEHAA